MNTVIYLLFHGASRRRTPEIGTRRLIILCNLLPIFSPSISILHHLKSPPKKKLNMPSNLFIQQETNKNFAFFPYQSRVLEVSSHICLGRGRCPESERNLKVCSRPHVWILVHIIVMFYKSTHLRNQIPHAHNSKHKLQSFILLPQPFELYSETFHLKYNHQKVQ